MTRLYARCASLAALAFVLVLVPVSAQTVASEVTAASSTASGKSGPSLGQDLRSQDKAIQRRAAQALIEMGPAGDQMLREALVETDGAVRENLAAGLVEMGTRAVPSLLRILLLLDSGANDEVRRSATTYVLVAIGPAAYPVIHGFIQSASKDQRLAAIGALYFQGWGKTAPPEAIDDLVRLAESDPDNEIRGAATRSLGMMFGQIDRVTPILRRMLADRNLGVRLNAADGLITLSVLAEASLPDQEKIVAVLIEGLHSADKDERWSSIFQLQMLGPKAKPAIAALKQLLKDPDLGQDAAQALGAIGEAALPAVQDAARDASPEVQQHAARALQEMGGQGSEAIPQQLQALKDSDPRVRLGAAQALSEIARGRADAVPGLTAALNDSNQGVRRAAAAALGNVGPPAATAVPLLRKILKQGDHDDQLTAAMALGGIGPDAEPALPDIAAMIPALSSDYAFEAQMITESLARMGPAAWPTLAGLLKAETSEFRMCAASSLLKIGPAGRELVPALVEALKDQDEFVPNFCTQALGSIGPGARLAVPAVIGQLQKNEGNVRSHAIGALMQIAPDDPAVHDALRKAADGQDAELALEAAIALAKSASDPKVLPVLIKAATSDAESLSYFGEQIADALGALGPEAKTGIPVLVEWMGRPSERPMMKSRLFGPLRPLPIAAAENLLRIDPHHAAARAHLLGLLHGADERDQLDAAAALLNVSQETAATVETLDKLMQSEHPETALSAARVLLRVEGRKARAVAVLEGKLTDDDIAIRASVAQTLAHAGQGTPEILRVLSERLHSREEWDRQDALQAMAALGPKAAPLADAARNCRSDFSADVRAAAYSALSAMEQQ